MKAPFLSIRTEISSRSQAMTESVPNIVPKLAKGELHVVEEVVKKSRFITYMARAESPEEAREIIARIKEKHRDATHNCWAYVACRAGDSSQVGASDDGEPAGTAGRPMLAALLHSGVGEIVAVVTRYFGGTLLGTGGLVRAYQGGVLLGLKSLPTEEKKEGARVLVSVDMPLAGSVEHFVRQFGGSIISTDFRFDASFECMIDEDRFEEFNSMIMGLSSGEALVEKIEE